MQSGLISTDRLPSKFEHELHANEIVPLAYYVASMNIEGVFHELCPNEVYVTNGSGLWNGFTMRVGVPSEITFITLE